MVISAQLMDQEYSWTKAKGMPQPAASRLHLRQLTLTSNQLSVTRNCTPNQCFGQIRAIWCRGAVRN